MVEWETPQRVGRIDLYLWGDGRGVDAPRDYVVEYWNGSSWVTAEVLDRLPTHPRIWARNIVRIAPVETTRLRVVLEHDAPMATGVTEMEVWGGT